MIIKFDELEELLEATVALVIVNAADDEEYLVFADYRPQAEIFLHVDYEDEDGFEWAHQFRCTDNTTCVVDDVGVHLKDTDDTPLIVRPLCYAGQ